MLLRVALMAVTALSRHHVWCELERRLWRLIPVPSDLGLQMGCRRQQDARWGLLAGQLRSNRVLPGMLEQRLQGVCIQAWLRSRGIAVAICNVRRLDKGMPLLLLSLRGLLLALVPQARAVGSVCLQSRRVLQILLYQRLLTESTPKQGLQVVQHPLVNRAHSRGGTLCSDQTLFNVRCYMDKFISPSYTTCKAQLLLLDKVQNPCLCIWLMQDAQG